jgi:hypothetical protein
MSGYVDMSTKAIVFGLVMVAVTPGRKREEIHEHNRDDRTGQPSDLSNLHRTSYTVLDSIGEDLSLIGLNHAVNAVHLVGKDVLEDLIPYDGRTNETNHLKKPESNISGRYYV